MKRINCRLSDLIPGLEKQTNAEEPQSRVVPPDQRKARPEHAIALAQRMRESKWVDAQVNLVGAVDCPGPENLQIIQINQRYEINHRAVREARAGLPLADQQAIRSYLWRADALAERTDDRGFRYYATQPPRMEPEEATAFRHLWRVLHDMNALTRLAPPRREAEALEEEL